VRQAIALLFDFEWVNRNFFFDLYRRSASFFDDSELSAYHRPADARERALLAPFPDAVRADVLDGTWSPPVSDGSGRDREPCARRSPCSRPRATNSSGTTLRERQRPAVHFRDHGDNRDDERLALAFASNLARAGISARCASSTPCNTTSAARRSIST
jgi:peptide/nickel transport system substrate-binding protein